MRLPFTEQQFFALFAAYNEAIWPAQAVLYALALAAVVLAVRPSRRRDAVAAGILATLWVWGGAAYHLAHFAAINPAARVFAALFLLQAALFVWLGVVRRRLRFSPPAGWRGWFGGVVVGYALVVYPLLGIALGHPPRELPVIGTPCPTTLLTLGLLFWARPPLPRLLLAVPLLWSAIGTTAAFTLGVPQDLALLVVGLVALVLLRHRRPGTPAPGTTKLPRWAPLHTGSRW